MYVCIYIYIYIHTHITYSMYIKASRRRADAEKSGETLHRY